MEHYINKTNRQAYRFDSPLEAVAAACLPLPSGCVSDGRKTGSQLRMGPGWAGTETFEQACELARVGWPEGLAPAAELRAQLVDAVRGCRTMKPRVTVGVCGFAPSVPALLAGSPCSMLTMRHEMRAGSGKVVTVVFNGGALADITDEAMIRRGAICLALVDLLEGAGYRCDVWRYSHASGHGGEKTATFGVNLKRPEEALDMDSLAFWLVNPAAHRRFVFCLRETLAYAKFECTGGEYRTLEMPAEEQGDLYMSAARLDLIGTNEKAADYLRAQLKTQGVEFDS